MDIWSEREQKCKSKVYETYYIQIFKVAVWCQLYNIDLTIYFSYSFIMIVSLSF